MKTKKTMTENALAANRENAQKSTGPLSTEDVSQNARKHGLLAKKLVFETDTDKYDFEQLLAGLEEDRQPVGSMERALVEEVATCLWKLNVANGWEMEELANRRAASKAIMQMLADHHDQQRLPLFTKWNGKASPAQLGWACQELVVRCDKGDAAQQLGYNQDQTSKTGRTQVEARLTASQDCILRYQGAIKRDLYRALAALREIQRERREMEK
jgi:hypothetical protein